MSEKFLIAVNDNSDQLEMFEGTAEQAGFVGSRTFFIEPSTDVFKLMDRVAQYAATVVGKGRDLVIAVDKGPLLNHDGYLGHDHSVVLNYLRDNIGALVIASSGEGIRGEAMRSFSDAVDILMMASQYNALLRLLKMVSQDGVQRVKSTLQRPINWLG